MDDRELDELRERMQKALTGSKRDQLREEFGMVFENTENSKLSPEMENEWLDYVLEFERQFETAQTITVRERIGNPAVVPLEEIPLYALEEAVVALEELLFQNGIVVDFMGEWDYLAVYRYLTEKLLDEEMDDIRIEGMITHFDASTPEYDVEMWVGNFVLDVFWRYEEDFVSLSKERPLLNAAGEPLSAGQFKEMVEGIRAKLPEGARADVMPIVTQVEGEEGACTAVVRWLDGEDVQKVESFFRLKVSVYTGWDVVQTSLLDDLLALLC